MAEWSFIKFLNNLIKMVMAMSDMMILKVAKISKIRCIKIRCHSNHVKIFEIYLKIKI